MLIVKIILAVVCAVLATILYSGKGDKLIAGYNTASKEEREEINITRLRIVMGTSMLATAAASFLLSEDITSSLCYCGAIFVICIITVIMANTWAKK